MATTKQEGKKAGAKAPPAAELPGLAELRRMIAAGRPARRSELAVKGSNALVSVVTFFAAALQEELAAGEAREAALTERLAAAERALVARGPLVPLGEASRRYRGALVRLLAASTSASGSGPFTAEQTVVVDEDVRAALRFVLGEP